MSRLSPAQPVPAPVVEEPGRQRYLLGQLLRLTGRYWPQCLRLILIQACLIALSLASLGGVGLAIDLLRAQIDPSAPAVRVPFGAWTPPDSKPETVLLLLGGVIFVAALLRAVLTYANTVAANRLGQGRIVVDLRSRVYAQMQRLSFRFFDANATGSLINRVTGDTQAVRLFIDGVAMQSLQVLLAAAVYCACLIRVHAGLTFACLVFLPVLWILVTLFARWLRRDYVEGRRRVDRLVLVFEELARGIGVVKNFGLEGWAEKRFLEANAAVRDQKTRVFRKLTILHPTVSLLNQLSMAILLGYGGWLAIRGEIAIGTGLVVFAGILQQLAAQVTAVGNIADHLQQTLTGADRVYQILDAKPDVDDRPEAKALTTARGHIVFENVSFRFRPENTVLHSINLAVSAGERIAIVGPTGAGKSALLQLIPRFYDPDAGRVLLDGAGLRDWKLEDVRRQVGLVFQESFLFSASIAANIAFGDPAAGRDAIERAAKLASAHEFIETLPQGYDTLLQENGSNLSGGQRQRLALARAVLLDPAILILDDPTAAVDAETEQEILDSMDGAMQDRTTFLVTHRLSAVRRARRIVVLNGGRIEAMGTHAELAAAAGYYRDAMLAEQQGSLAA
ncbi:MAG TPA: ABC transporter ATP-binding protein [Verrucomicrobiales bacterium]|nr:ABC transporter ATP-binding protein [Verrucomicrobiales bacterium]